MKATSLEQMSADYCFVMEQKEIALATLHQKEQVQCVAVHFYNCFAECKIGVL